MKILFLKDNPLESPPLETTMAGIEAIRNYFRQRQEEGLNDYPYRKSRE